MMTPENIKKNASALSCDRQVNRKTYNILPGSNRGVISADYLEKIARVVKKYDIPLLKITAAQRLAIGGHPAEITADILRDLGLETDPKKSKGIHYIKACPGSRWCKYGQQDSLALADKIEAAISMSLPAKTKVGISGCSLNCCEGFLRDIGIFGKKKGWTLVFGGNGGGVPRIGDIIGQGLDDNEVIELATKCLIAFTKLARPTERSAKLMSRISLDEFKEMVRMAHPTQKINS